jgi:hypothetical protein
MGVSFRIMVLCNIKNNYTIMTTHFYTKSISKSQTQMGMRVILGEVVFGP